MGSKSTRCSFDILNTWTAKKSAQISSNLFGCVRSKIARITYQNGCFDLNRERAFLAAL